MHHCFVQGHPEFPPLMVLLMAHKHTATACPGLAAMSDSGGQSCGRAAAGGGSSMAGRVGGERVLLFERNGLQHGGFDLPGPGALQTQQTTHVCCRLVHQIYGLHFASLACSACKILGSRSCKLGL